MHDIRDLLVAGQRVAVTQQVAQRDRAWALRVEGRVVSYEQQKTVSPFAHGRDGMLWLDRLVLQKDDAEIVILNLNGLSRVEAAPEVEARGAAGHTQSST